MKKDYIFLTLASVLFLAVGCTDEFETQTTIKRTGDEILFGGRASYTLNENDGATRTIYTGETYTEGDKTLEGINWIAGDQVRIYCPQTVNANVADYTVTAETTSADVEEDADGNKKGKYRYTYLSKSSEQTAALQWGNTSLTHSFYSVYPSSQQYIGGAVSDDDVIKSGTVLNGYIPSVQIPKNGVSELTDGNYVAAPDMKYAYMVARTDVMPNEISDNVFLQYMPIATAVEITLTNHTDTKHENSGNDPADQPYEFKLTNITIGSADDTPIYGQFRADLSTMQDSDGDGYADETPVVEAIEGTLGTHISIPTLENGTSGNPTVLGINESITVTVFMLPTVDLNSLKVTITGVEGIRTATIKGNGANDSGFSIKAGKKTYIRNLPLTADILPFNLNNWLQFIEDDVYVREISIPGTGGAATYALTDDDISNANLSVKKEFVAEQLYDLRHQWEQGVRCFEFSVDKSTTSDNLGDSKIICSGVQMAMTLSDGVGQVQELLKNNPKEFAMVIITYETAGGWSGTRSPSDFMNQLNTFWSSVKASTQGMNTTELADAGIEFDTQLYDPSTATVGASRGKLFCIARPTSAHLDYGTDVIDVKAYETAKMNNNNTVGDYNIEAAKRVAFLPSDEIKESWDDLELPDIHSDIMVIHGWGTLKDKWQQRGFTNYSKRGTGDSYTFDFSYNGYTYGSETTSEPGRPFDGAFFHSSNHSGWGSTTPDISTGETGYTVTITPAEGGSYTLFEVTGVTSTLGDVSQDGDNYVIDLGGSKPTEDFIITVNYTCSYYRSNNTADTDGETVQTKTITPDDLDYNNNVFTLTATASRSVRANNYTYTYSYDWSGPVNGTSSNVGTYYGNLPSTASTITPSALTPDFGYDVVVEGTKTATAWVQEWARVSNSTNYYWDNETADCRDGYSDCTGYYVSYWAPSYAEKLQRATEALTYAREKTKGLVYINSLCGYYVTKEYPSSSAPCSWTDCGYGSTSQGQGYNEIWVLSASSPISGLGGDIAGFAEQINTDFYNHLLSLTSESDYVPGPMGVILLDRVGEDNSKGSLIAGLVVSNNFLFELATDPNYNQSTNSLSLIEAESEEPQYAPATRNADGKEEFTVTWE